MLPVEFADELLLLLSEKAIAWPRAKALIVADLHLGKAASFRAGGVPVPEGGTHADLFRLAALIDAHRCEHLIILGDLLHARSGCTKQTLGALALWRNQHADLHVTLIRGNHDLNAGDPPAELGFEVLSEPAPYTGPRASNRTSSLRFAHDPAIVASGVEKKPLTLCGHLHPAVSLTHASGLAAMRAPCFWFSQNRAVLPAFGSFTGTAKIRPAQGDRVFAVGPKSVVEIHTRSRHANAMVHERSIKVD